MSNAAKRLFDLAVAGCGLLLIAPLMAIIGIAIKATSEGPILFRQVRIGRNEQPFRIMKFRTMSKNAPSQGAEITVGADPRITRIGAVLRRYKLDELPQLINVVLGDMSLVGPRPETPNYVALYPSDERREIFQVRPGITDNASIIFSNESDLLSLSDKPLEYYTNIILPRKRALYLEYVRNRSFFGDIGIIWRTILAILNQRGAQS